MKKLAIFFPGIGYTADKPLMYFSRRLAVTHGYEILTMDYSGFPPKVKGDRSRMEESFAIAYAYACEKLSGVDWTACKDILFVGKSIGTIVAAKIASDSAVRDRIRMVMYTPLEDTFAYEFGSAICFTGDDDPWVGKKKSQIRALCAARDIPCMVVPEANHSLESEDVIGDMKTLRKVMKETEQFMRQL